MVGLVGFWWGSFRGCRWCCRLLVNDGRPGDVAAIFGLRGEVAGGVLCVVCVDVQAVVHEGGLRENVLVDVVVVGL